MDSLLKRLDEASYEGDVDKLKQLLEEDPLLLDKVLIEVKDNPLHIAALRGDVNFTTEVVELRPELARKLNTDGRSALHLAAGRGHLQVAEILVDKVGGDICSIRDTNHGYMPVHIAIVNGNHDLVRMLGERCKDTLEETSNKKETLFHLAVKANCLDSICYLINQNAKLNEKDVNGNTCLHLAAAKPNRQVIGHLLDQEDIHINSTNHTGQTPLDVILTLPLYADVDISDLAVTIQSAGGMRGTELTDLESNMSSPAVPPRNQRLSRRNKNTTGEKLSDAQTLLIVATLVATMTFQAITNPPGGFIQPPIDKRDTFIGLYRQFFYMPNGTFNLRETFNSTWIKAWEDQFLFPAGRPVLLSRLQNFFILDSVALFSSVSVILWLLIAEPKHKIVMKFLVAIVWFAAFCTALAFGSAFSAIYVSHPFEMDKYGFRFNSGWFSWALGLLVTFLVAYATAGLWATVRLVRLLWRKAGFKTTLPNWIAKVSWLKDVTGFNRIIAIVRWLKGSTLFKKIIFGILIVCAVGAFLLTNLAVYILIFVVMSI